MTHNHWRVIAIVGGVAAGFFYMATSSTNGATWPGTWVLSLYRSGASIGSPTVAA